MTWYILILHVAYVRLWRDIFLKMWLIFLYTNMINMTCIYILTTTLYVNIYMDDGLCVFV